MSNAIAKLNPRERALGMVIGLLVVGGGLVFAGLTAYRTLDSLDSDIARLEQELMNLAQQNAQRGAVETAYREVVAEHSSELTKQEIHDNLRREIVRLAKIQVRGKGKAKEGQGVRERDLVKIPTLREGTLNEDTDGYREYQIQFRIPQARLQNVIQFLTRIERSNQILRVDSLDLTRAPEAKLVEASIVITRIVLDSPDGPGRTRAGDRSARAVASRGDA